MRTLHPSDCPTVLLTDDDTAIGLLPATSTPATILVALQNPDTYISITLQPHELRALIRALQSELAATARR